MRVYFQIDADAPAPSTSGADALILDLRASALDRSSQQRTGMPHADAVTFLRIDDVDAIGNPSLRRAIELTGAAGLVVSVASGRDLERAGAMLAVVEAQLGLPDRGLRLIGMIDEPAALLSAGSLAGCSTRLAGLSWDAGRLASRLGARVPWSPEHGWTEVLAQSRALVRLAAAAARIEAIETTSPIAGSASCRTLAEAAERDGFAAMMARTPEEIEAIRDAGIQAARP